MSSPAVQSLALKLARTPSPIPRPPAPVPRPRGTRPGKQPWLQTGWSNPLKEAPQGGGDSKGLRGYPVSSGNSKGQTGGGTTGLRGRPYGPVGKADPGSSWNLNTQYPSSPQKQPYRPGSGYEHKPYRF